MVNYITRNTTYRKKDKRRVKLKILSYLFLFLILKGQLSEIVAGLKNHI